MAMRAVRVKVLRFGVKGDNENMQELYYVDVPERYQNKKLLILMHPGELLGILEDKEMQKEAKRKVLRLIIEGDDGTKKERESRDS